MAGHDAQPAARPDCDHHWIGHLRGGEPLSVRICSLCGDPDWDDLRRQLDERDQAQPFSWQIVHAQPRQHGTIDQLVRDAEKPAVTGCGYSGCEVLCADPDCPAAQGEDLPDAVDSGRN